MLEAKDIFNAYRKLKNTLYYDKSALYARYKLAKEEMRLTDMNSLVARYQNIIEIVNNKDDKAFDKLLDTISYRLIPKSVDDGNKSKGSDEKEEFKFFSNDTSLETVTISKFNYLFDGDIALYIISVLWLMKVAPRYAASIRKNNYAYRYKLKNSSSVKDTPENSDSLSIYQPYFIGFSEWRDKALRCAEELVESGNDATIVCLDIQRYFYSINLNLACLLEDMDVYVTEVTKPSEEEERLTDLMQKIHERYTMELPEGIRNSYKKEIGCSMLPLGLPSSGFIANLYLSKFDEKVLHNLNPDFYGRYVDDIMIVIRNRKVEEPASFIKDVFCEGGKLLKIEDGNPLIQVVLEDQKPLVIQKEKVVIQYVSHKGSRAVLNNFVNRIQSQSSEFNYLPDLDDMLSNFDDEAFELGQEGDINKLRDIKNFKGNRFGASKFLSKKIQIAKLLSDIDKKRAAKDSQQILSFFSGALAIDNYALWQKVAIYLVLYGDTKSLSVFYRKIKEVLSRIVIGEEELVPNKKLIDDLNDYLNISIATAIAPNPKLIDGVSVFDGMKEMTLFLRSANMFPHDIVSTPLINYMLDVEDKEYNFYQYHVLSVFYNEDDSKKFKFNVKLVQLSPRLVKLQEICMALQMCYKFSNKNLNVAKELYYYFLSPLNSERFLAEASLFDVKPKEIIDQTKNNTLCLYLRTLEEESVIDTHKKIAISNIKIDSNTIKNHNLQRPEYKEEQVKKICKVVNEAIQNRADILVLPELCMPYQLFMSVVDKCKNKGMALITGLQYAFNDDQKTAYNRVAVVLPIVVNGCTMAVITMRQKNFLAPGEELLLGHYGYSRPNTDTELFIHYQWRNLYFTVYNCFELADIASRCLFKSEIDVIFATEVNKDTTYYSDIVGATVRDLHCYFVQSNTSEYGDSRITEPSKHEMRDLIKVKGGQNASAIVEEIDLNKLREFQMMKYSGQEKNDRFKYTPPKYDQSKTLRRIQNLSMYEDGK